MEQIDRSRRRDWKRLTKERICVYAVSGHKNDVVKAWGEVRAGWTGAKWGTSVIVSKINNKPTNK